MDDWVNWTAKPLKLAKSLTGEALTPEEQSELTAHLANGARLIGNVCRDRDPKCVAMARHRLSMNVRHRQVSFRFLVRE